MKVCGMTGVRVIKLRLARIRTYLSFHREGGGQDFVGTSESQTIKKLLLLCTSNARQ